MQTQKIGKYELIGLIARGGMGDVYLARSGGLSGFNKLVVVKTLKPEFAQDENFRQMFLDEARLAARLNHRNIIQTNDVGDADGQYFMVMEYVEGHSLASIYRRAKQQGGAVEVAAKAKIIAEMLVGLHHAHELCDYDGHALGVVHRDVCPSNVMVSFDGQVRVADFGIAKAKNQVHETQAGTLKGRVAYMSPEHVTGKGLDRRADIFCAGIMLWEAIFDEKFWGTRSEGELLGALIRGELPPPPEGKTPPPGLLAVAQKALKLSPEQRFQTAEEMSQAIEVWLTERGGGSPLGELRANMVRWFAEERALISKQLDESASRGLAGGDLPLLGLSQGSFGTASTNDTGRPSRNSMLGTANTSQSALRTPTSSVIVIPPSRAPWAIALAAVIGLVGVTWKLTRPPEVTTATAATQDSARLTVEATPAHARIFVDDAEMASNPFQAIYPRGQPHTIRVVAPGFSPRSERVELTDNVTLKIGLEASSPQASVAGVEAPAPSSSGPRLALKNTWTPAATPTPAPSGGPVAVAPAAAGDKPAPRSVHTDNPYATAPAAAPPPLRTVDAANPYKK